MEPGRYNNRAATTVSLKGAAQVLEMSLLSVAPLAGVGSFKTVKQVLPRTPQHWVGNGFHVHPVFGRYAFTDAVSPFLMLDYAVPKEFSASSQRHAPVLTHIVQPPARARSTRRPIFDVIGSELAHTAGAVSASIPTEALRL